MKIWIARLATVTTMLTPLASAGAQQQTPRPTIVLVYGAFAESGSRNGATERLHADGYIVIAASNPLRGMASDAALVAGVVNSVTTPVVLVGHSYGGPIIPELGTHAGSKKTVVVAGASHVVMTSNPKVVAALIEEAATAQ